MRRCLSFERISLVVWAASLCVVAAALSGCGLSCGEGDAPAPASAPTSYGDAIRLKGPGAARYAEPTEPGAFDRKVTGVLGELASRRLTYDGCLARAAQEYGRHVLPRGGQDDRPPRNLQEVVLHHAGCTDGWVSSHVFYTSSDNEEDFLAHIKASFADLDSAATTHFGAGKAPALAPYKWTYVLLLAERHVVFEPVRRSVPVGEPLEIAGRLLDGLKEPDVLVLEPEGEVQALDVTEWEDGRFSATATFDRPGEQWIELLAEGDLGPRVAGLFPVYVGVEPPTEIPLEVVPDESTIVETEDAERLMFKLVNQDRERFGLPALLWSDEIASIARRHSRDMRDNRYFAHVSPYQGDLSQRFETGAFAARSLGENISRNDSVYDAEAGLMQSLGHRENLLNPTFTHIGVGVAFGVDAYGHRSIYFTQNFATPQRTLSSSEALDEIYVRVDERRQRRKLDAIERDRDLQSIAARFARFGDQADGGYPAADLTQRIKRALVDQGYVYRAFYIQTHTVLDPSDVNLPSALFDPSVSRVGIGVYPSRSPSGAVRWKTLIVLAEI